MTATEATAKCPGCDSPAPPPSSDEVNGWTFVPGDGRAIWLCPQCSNDPETCRRVEDEWDRHYRLNARLSPYDPDQVLFVRGKATVYADCTLADLKWLVKDDERWLEQGEAWASWLEAAIEVKKARGN
jgi:hypothetical protein